MKTKLFAVAIIAGIVVLILGWDRTYSYITTGKRLFDKRVDEAMPFFVEIERAQGMVDDLDTAIWEYQEKLVGIRIDMDYSREEIAAKEEQLKKEKELLEEISMRLEQKQDYYHINAKSYSYREVNDDALLRARAYRWELEYLKAKKENLKVMEDTAKLLEQEIEMAQAKKQEFENMIATLRAKHSQLEAKKELAVLSDGINIREFRKNHFARINQVVRNLEKRQEKTERLLEGLIGLRAQPGRIDYGNESKDALEEIQSLLDSNS